MTPEEMAALIEAATAPDPKRPTLGTDDPSTIVREFIAAHGLRPGRVPAVELCSVYRLYREWNAKHEQPKPVLSANHFARKFRAFGFYKRVHLRSGGRFRREIKMHDECAKRLRAWLKKNPDTPADRAMCRTPLPSRDVPMENL